MKHGLNRAKMWLLITTFLLLTASFYLAHLSGRAMSAAVGDTFESLDLSALVGVLAMVFGVPLITIEQTGGFLLRIAKLAVTFACWFSLQVFVCFLIQSLSAA